MGGGRELDVFCFLAFGTLLEAAAVSSGLFFLLLLVLELYTGSGGKERRRDFKKHGSRDWWQRRVSVLNNVNNMGFGRLMMAKGKCQAEKFVALCSLEYAA